MLAVLAGGGTIAITALPGDGSAPETLTVPIDGADADTKRDDALVLDESAKDQLEAGPKGELAQPLREPGDPAEAGVLEGPLAAQEFPGCRTRFVGNFSSRNGATPRLIVWHQTVSRERGWSSQDALTAMANRRSSQVSWHLLIGRSEGRCTFTVPLSSKAWTQSNANPFSVGIEVEAFGDELSYVAGEGRKRLVAATREIGRIYGIPMQRGKVENCRPVRAGIVEHHDLGACGGGHVDVSSTAWQRNPSAPERPGWDIGPLIAEARNGGVTGVDRVTCRKLNWWRRAGRPAGKAARNAVRRRRALEARGVTCTSSGPVKA